MKSPTEEVPTAADTANADALVRSSLIRAEAMAALTASKCRANELFCAYMERNLAAIHVGEGAYRVAVTDDKGNISAGARGPMSAAELIALLRTRADFERIGWR